MASNCEFIDYKDFDIEKLNLCKGKENKNYGFKTFNIEYTYPDGVTKSLRLRSPLLFSYGIKNNKMGDDYCMHLKSYYDISKSIEKETKFCVVLDNISKVLKQKLQDIDPKKKYKGVSEINLDKMSIKTDSGYYFPKLRETKVYENNKVIGSEIASIFYGKEKDGTLAIKDPLFFKEKPCKAIIYLDIADIFVKSPTIFKIRTYISEAIVVKMNVPIPFSSSNRWETTSNVSIGSDDEEDDDEEEK